MIPLRSGRRLLSRDFCGRLGWGALILVFCAAAAAAMELPPPNLNGVISLEQALQQRHSVREYRNQELSASEVAQLLWAAQGVNRDNGHRTVPSAGALYPLEIYLVVGDVTGLPVGVYRYLPLRHQLQALHVVDVRQKLASAALGQAAVRRAPALLVIAAAVARTTGKYGRQAERYVALEAGAASQNVYLQARALGLGTVAVGAFDASAVHELLHLPFGETPLLLMPLGKE